MKQYALLAFLSPVASLLAVTGPAQSEKLKTKTNPQKQPNVIFIYADDLGYGDLECYGAKNVQTPHVNQLAESGVQFTNAHATAATSTPSRYSMLTGKYAWRVPGLGTEAEKVEKLSPLFFSTPRNSLVCWAQRPIPDQRKNLRDFHFMHII